MNLFAINGAAIDGTSVLPIAASASAAAGVTVAANATRTSNAQASAHASANVTAGADAFAGGFANISGTASLTLDPQHTQAAVASVTSTAAVRAVVLRVIQSSADFLGAASMQAIPASLLASANLTTGAAVSANATKIQPGHAAAGTTTGMSAAPVVTRYVSAAFAGSAKIRAEAQYNNHPDGFANIVGVSSFALPSVGVVQRRAFASIVCGAALQPTATYTHNGAAQAATHVGFSASATVSATPYAAVQGAASVSAAPTRFVVPSLGAQAGCTVAARAALKHAATAAAKCGAALNPELVVTQFAAVAAQGTAAVVAYATAFRNPEADITVRADVQCAATVDQAGTATANAGTGMDVAPIAIMLATVNGVATAEFMASAAVARYTAAALVGNTSFTADALCFAPGRAQIIASARISAQGGLAAYGVANAVAGTSILAIARLNIEAYDPPEKTMYRPFIDTEMRRPFTDTEMRRAA